MPVKPGVVNLFEAASSPLPASGLGHAHIFEAPTGDHGMEFFETVFEGDGSRRLRGGIAVPTAEFCNDPRGPRKASIGMRILLQRCLAFEGGVETLEHGHFVRAEGDGGRLALGTI